MRVVIAGASGFVGHALIEHLLRTRVNQEDCLIGISRAPGRQSKDSRLTWRHADLLDLDQTLSAVEGGDIAFYLVHAMLPKTQLSQGSFEDFDLIQADNFAKACAVQGVKKIIYLGALMPSHSATPLSSHLKSRLETETILRAQGGSVTVLRTGLILGTGGSSSELLVRLIRRLPIMIAPKWLRTRTEVTDIRDVVKALQAAMEKDFLQGQCWDLGNGEPLLYQSLLLKVAKTLHLKRIIISAPFFTPGLSRLWVSLITGAPKELLSPLIQSLKCEMLPREQFRLFSVLNLAPLPLNESIDKITTESSKPHAYITHSRSSEKKSIRSIQRFSLPKNSIYLNPEEAVHAYFRWLPKSSSVLFESKKLRAKNRIAFDSYSSPRFAFCSSKK